MPDNHKPEKKKPAPPRVDVLKVFKKSPKRAEKSPLAGPLAVPSVEWKRLCRLTLAVVAIAIATYANSIWGELVFNDYSTLSFLRGARDPDALWGQILSQSLAMPLSQGWLKATYVSDFQNAGMGIWWYHIVNVILHTVTCVYLLALTFRLSWRFKQEMRFHSDPYHLAFATAALFACHPMTSESVAYISGRVAPLLTSTYLLSLNCFLSGFLAVLLSMKTWSYLFAAAFFALGLLISPEALTIPVSMLALTIVVKKPSVPFVDWAVKHNWVLAALVLVAGSAPYLALKGLQIQAGNGTGLAILPPVSYWASQCKNLIAYYLPLSVVPLGLSIDPAIGIASNFSDPLAVLGAAVLVAIAFSIWFFRQRPLIAWSLFVILIGYLPMAVIPQPEYVSDKRFYLPLAGVCTILAALLASLATRSLRRALIVFTAIIAVFMSLTVWRNYEWSSNKTLWESTIRANPRSARAHAMLALDLLRHGQPGKAEKEAKEAISLDSNNYYALIAEGGASLQTKRYKKASDTFSKALQVAARQQISEELTEIAQVQLAEAYLMQGNAVEALSLAQQVLTYSPDSARVHYIIGYAHLKEKNYHQALTELQYALKLAPGMLDVYEPLAEAALAAQVPQIAYQAALALSIRSPSVKAQLLLARAAMALLRDDEAEKTLTTLLQKEPKSAEILALLFYLKSHKGDKDKAALYKEKALSLDKEIFKTLSDPYPQMDTKLKLSQP